MCKKCNEFPRVWEFNNGSTARCCCPDGLYTESPARAESIGSVVKRTGGFAEYSRDGLRLAWNKFVETGQEQNKLIDGQW